MKHTRFLPLENDGERVGTPVVMAMEKNPEIPIFYVNILTFFYKGFINLQRERDLK